MSVIQHLRQGVVAYCVKGFGIIGTDDGYVIVSFQHFCNVMEQSNKSSCSRACRPERVLFIQAVRQSGSLTSRESFIYRAIVIEARYYKGMNKARGSSWGEGAGHHPKLPKLVVTAAAKKINMLDEYKLLV